MKVFLFIFLFFHFTTKSYTQFNPIDSLFYQKATQNTIAQYHENIGYHSKLFNGSQYASYPYQFKQGHPFFISDEFENGSLVYNQVLFSNVKLLYNEVSDLIIIKDQTHLTQLISEQVSSFTLNDHIFIRIKNENLQNKSKIPEGFYQVIYDGKVKAFSKEKKVILDDISSASEGIKRYIVIKNSFYIKKENDYYLIGKKKDIINLFSNNKKEINDFIKRNNLDFKRNKMELITEVTAYYDQLTQ